MVNSALCVIRFYNEEHITWRGYVIGFELFFKSSLFSIRLEFFILIS